MTTHDSYDDLPEGVKMIVTRDGYKYTPDKDRLVQDIVNPDLEDDLEDETDMG